MIFSGIVTALSMPVHFVVLKQKHKSLPAGTPIISATG
jgi:hypothetical protein